MENNKVQITGFIKSGFELSHTVFEKKFYSSSISSCRDSGTEDIIPIIIPEDKIDNKIGNYMDKYVSIVGQFHSYNYKSETDKKMLFQIFVKKMKVIEKDSDKDTNEVFLDGYICKEPVYRETPLGRKIADVLLAVNRPYGKTDYIPCIFWGRNAIMASMTKVGMHLAINGRLQSRNYMKKKPNGTSEQRVAYEVSVNGLEVIE